MLGPACLLTPGKERHWVLLQSWVLDLVGSRAVPDLRWEQTSKDAEWPNAILGKSCLVFM